MTIDNKADSQSAHALTSTFVFVLAFVCASVVANVYYTQPLTALIGTVLHIAPAGIGLLVTATQIGYGLGLLLVVPLGDLVENRNLVLVCLCTGAAALVAMATAQAVAVFLVATFVLGVACTTIQVLLPYAAHFATEANRGRVIGKITSGLMLGIMLARPTASFIAHSFGWRAVFGLSAIAMVWVAGVLVATMPSFRPHSALSYLQILRSLPPLLRDIPILRRRAAYHAALYASFSLFWTAVPLLLASSRFGLNQQGIGLFALAGTGGVVIAPMAGWIADRGLTKPATGFAMLAVLVAFGVAFVGGQMNSIALLVLAAILIDAGLVVNFVLSQRLIYGSRPESRSRIGGLFTAIFFIGGALGSSAAAASFVAGGWRFTCCIGLAFAASALLVYATEFFQQKAPLFASPGSARS